MKGNRLTVISLKGKQRKHKEGRKGGQENKRSTGERKGNIARRAGEKLGKTYEKGFSVKSPKMCVETLQMEKEASARMGEKKGGKKRCTTVLGKRNQGQKIGVKKRETHNGLVVRSILCPKGLEEFDSREVAGSEEGDSCGEGPPHKKEIIHTKKGRKKGPGTACKRNRMFFFY